jgi:glycosyltransferase involved in cell wall biosynthesis
MARAPSAVFLIHLVQDVNILRPLIFMAAGDFQFDTLLLLSSKFSARDNLGIWRDELDEISSAVGARIEHFDDDWEAHGHLNGHGLLFSASESHLQNHATTHDIFRHAPPSYLRVTLQHGFECVGFRHSAAHTWAHGQTASFAADILCAWAPKRELKSLATSQSGKVIVTGPPSALQLPTGTYERPLGATGLVCENLHSVRFSGAGEARSEFIKTFAEFARQLNSEGSSVTLRPHPGGQYFLKGRHLLPSNVRIENSPSYRLDLRQFAYGISAPSSVLVEMLMAGIPTAVWRDCAGEIDTESYGGLATVSSPGEWLDFAQRAKSDPESFLERQRRFLAETKIPFDPTDVYNRFAELFRAAKRMEVRPPGAVAERERLLIVANSNLPTVQLSFEKPLAPLVSRGEMASRLFTEQHLRAEPDLVEDDRRLADFIEDYLDRYNPSSIIFSRYSGPGYQSILDWARKQRVPVIYHIDDDLLAVPRDIGERKFAVHNAPARLQAVRTLLECADLVYVSTEKLRERLLGYLPNLPIVAGKIYCSASILRRPRKTAALKIGYMASADHAHNLDMVLPALERLLDANETLRFELFGSIPVPERLRRFGERISTAAPVANYANFLNEFAKLEWDVGICPLAPIDFNMTKANTKWVECTAIGAAVVASRGTVYDDCCADSCGVLADGADEWFSALDLLVNNVEERIRIVERAQAKLEHEYNTGSLRDQVLNIIAQGHAAVAARPHRKQKQEEVSVCQLP